MLQWITPLSVLSPQNEWDSKYFLHNFFLASLFVWGLSQDYHLITSAFVLYQRPLQTNGHCIFVEKLYYQERVTLNVQTVGHYLKLDIGVPENRLENEVTWGNYFFEEQNISWFYFLEPECPKPEAQGFRRKIPRSPRCRCFRSRRCRCSAAGPWAFEY